MLSSLIACTYVFICSDNCASISSEIGIKIFIRAKETLMLGMCEVQLFLSSDKEDVFQWTDRVYASLSLFSLCVSVCLSVCLSFCLSVCLCACVPVCLSVCLSFCLSVRLCVSLCLCFGQFVCLSTSMFACLSLGLCVDFFAFRPSISLCVYLSSSIVQLQVYLCGVCWSLSSFRLACALCVYGIVALMLVERYMHLC